MIIDSPTVSLSPGRIGAHRRGRCDDGGPDGCNAFDALVDTAEQLSRTHAPVIGAVLNGMDFECDSAYDRSLR